MVNIHKSISSRGYYISLETIDYMYPMSHLILEYELDRGKKVHHVFIGCLNGRMALKSKNTIPKKIQKLILSNYFSLRFINKLSEL